MPAILVAPGALQNASNMGCRLPICNLHPAGSPRLFANEHSDGAGHRLKNILDGMAVANRYGFNFGGALPCGRSHRSHVTEHGHNFQKLLDAFFGLDAQRSLLLPTRNIKFKQSFQDVGQLDKWLHEQDDDGEPHKFREGVNFYVGSCSGWAHLAQVKDIFADEFYPNNLRRLLGEHLRTHPVEVASGGPSVAVHLRRGDLRPDDRRAAPSQYYLGVLDVLTELLPKTPMHLWSSIENSREHTKGQRHWNSSHFDVFKQRGVRVHLDDSSLITPWAHLSQATVLVASESAFSLVPAYLNMNCVIIHGHHDRPLPNWVDGLSETFRQDIRGCIDRWRARQGESMGSEERG